MPGCLAETEKAIWVFCALLVWTMTTLYHPVLVPPHPKVLHVASTLKINPL